MKKVIIATASILGGSSIILGAYGAHGLKEVLNPIQLNSFDTGVKYQMYHALFLLAIANFEFLSKNAQKVIFYCTLIGVVFFSFSIYLFSTNDLTTPNFKFLGPITPIGGLFLVASWLLLSYHTLKSKKE